MKKHHLRFAWIEYDSIHDGIAFHKEFTCRLGWGNLVSELPDSDHGKRKLDSAHPNLKIVRKSGALLILPGKEQAESDFIEEWSFSPGIKVSPDGTAELTTGPDSTDFAELMIIGGHGGVGTVFSFSGGSVDLSGYLRKRKDNWSQEDVRIDYLILATCTNVASFNAVSWLPAFLSPHPIRGILGFADEYKGRGDGSQVMVTFGENLKSGKTVLDSWKEANETVGWDNYWGALIHKNAREDTLKNWLAGQLSPVNKSDEIRHYENSTYSQNGLPVVLSDPDYETTFYMITSADDPACQKEEIAITIDNNYIRNTQVGFFQGEEGFLLLRAKNKKFQSGEKIRVVFFYWRPGKNGMDLHRLLQFDPSVLPRMKFMHLNEHPAVRKDLDDGFEYAISEGEEWEIMLPYVVIGDTEYYKADTLPEVHEETHGYFWIAIYPPDSNEIICRYVQGAFLRKSKILDLEYFDSELDPRPADPENPEVFQLVAGSDITFYLTGFPESELEISVWSRDGSQIQFNTLMSTERNPPDLFSLSSDQKVISLRRNRNSFDGTIHTLDILKKNGVEEKEFFLSVEYHGRQGRAVWEGKEKRFAFIE